MKEINEEILNWSSQFKTYHLPRWEELPEIDFYMDQVIEYINNVVSIFEECDTRLITPAMINNYVKLGLIPPPIKKKYSKIHISTLIVITILKQVTVISVISNAIKIQIKTNGGKGAYNIFCNQLEHEVRSIPRIISDGRIIKDEEVSIETLAVKSISIALVSKILANKTTQIRGENNE